MLNLKYCSYDIVFQEVPNETSLVFNISGCPHKCEGCHSKYLWDYVGNYVKNDYLKIIDRYNTFVTCVCFMGGDQNIEELYLFIKSIKEKYPSLKTCIYSGLQSITSFTDLINDDIIDYLKIGPYIKEYGGLDSEKTNQKFYRIKNKEFEDLTHLFRKSYNA